MIIIRITRADLVLPRYLYHVISSINWSEIEDYHGMTKMTYAEGMKMKREDGEKQMKLGELCNVMEIDSVNNQVSLMRGDITISDDNEVEIFE